jgi:hypothetical protein
MGLTAPPFVSYTYGMKPGPFVNIFALLARVDEKSLTVFDRNLKAAKILPVGGRGPSARDVDHEYFAKLLIARMATDKPARAVESFQRFSNMQLANEDMHRNVASLLADKDHNLLDLFRVICDPKVRLPADREFTISFTGQALVEVHQEKFDLTYIDRDLLAASTQAMLAAKGNSDRELDFLIICRDSSMSLHGIQESRSFTSTWLEDAKRLVFHEVAKAESGK